MPEATFNTSGLPYYLIQQGWQEEKDGNGNVTGYWRPAELDPSRGANQTGVQQGTDYAFEYVPADKFNGGNFSEDAVEYRTGGTSIDQHHPSKLMTMGVPIALALMAGGAGAESLGLFGEGGLNGLLGVGGATGAAGGNTVEALIAAGMNPSDALLMAGGEPIAGSGFSLASSGAPSFGTPFATGATLAQAGEAAGMINGLPNMIGVPGAIAGGALSVGSTMADLGNAVIPGVNAPAPGSPGGPSTTTSPPTDPSKPGGTNGLGLPTNLTDWAKLAALLGLPIASYLDAKDKNEFNPNTAMVDKLMKQKTWNQPQFTTGLLQPTFQTQIPNQYRGLLG